jgi:hypothetical protein
MGELVEIKNASGWIWKSMKDFHWTMTATSRITPFRRQHLYHKDRPKVSKWRRGAGNRRFANGCYLLFGALALPGRCI